jgi:hypothetical protein
VQIWYLFGWDGSWDTDAAHVDAVKGYYAPITKALENQGYSAPELKVSRFGPGLTRSSITLGDFVAGIKDVGVLILDGHAKADFLPVEVYQNSPAGRKAAGAAFKKYRGSGYSTADLGGTGPIRSSTGKTLAIGLTPTGIAHHLHGAKDSLVVLGMCHGTQAADGFVQAGARAAVYWSKQVQGPDFAHDTAQLFSHMDGTALSAPSLDDNAHRVLAAARAACSACSDQMEIAEGEGSTGMTLAPSVVARSPDPAGDRVSVGTPFDVGVTFDTVMERSSGSADGVVTLKGCGVQPRSSATAVRWQDDHTIRGTYTISSDGTLTITVHADQATSKGAGIKLNGNDGGTRSHDGAQAPNGDDFIWKVPCQATKVHIVFTGTGTGQSSRTFTFANGEVDTESYTDEASWTAVYNLDLTQVADAGGGTGYVVQGDTFDSAASTLSGTSSESYVVNACPNGGCTPNPPCTGTFSRRADVTPDLYVYSPPAADGTLKVLLPPYTLLDESDICAGHALEDSCDPQLAATPGSDSTGPLSAAITINPKTWKPTSYSVGPAAPINWTCSSGGSGTQITDTGSVTWSGTVTLSVPKTS